MLPSSSCVTIAPNPQPCASFPTQRAPDVVLQPCNPIQHDDGATFQNDNPTTITVGGIAAGSTFHTPVLLNELFRIMLYPFQAPGFASFAIAGVTSPLEVGSSFGPAVTFNWSTSQSGNVGANSITLKDITTAATLLSNTANDGTQAVTLPGAVTRSTAGTHVFEIDGVDTQPAPFNRQLTIAWQWRRYFGASANTSLTASQILALASNGLASGYAGSYSMGAGGYKFIALADAVGGQITSVKDASTQLAVPMVSGSHTDGGGYGYELVTVVNAQGVSAAVRVYRTLNALGSAVQMVVA